MKAHVKRMKRVWERIFAHHPSDKGIVWRIYGGKKLAKLSSKNQTVQLENEQQT